VASCEDEKENTQGKGEGKKKTGLKEKMDHCGNVRTRKGIAEFIGVEKRGGSKNSAS